MSQQNVATALPPARQPVRQRAARRHGGTHERLRGRTRALACTRAHTEREIADWTHRHILVQLA